MTLSRALIPTTAVRSHAPARLARGSMRSWTGRSVVTSATDRVRPRFATIGMHRTRVSEMREAASRTSVVRTLRAPTGSVTTSATRRRPFSSRTSG